MVTSTSLRFSTAARTLADEARRQGLAVPGFRSPPRLPGAVRTIRRWPAGGVVIAVTIRGRPVADVVADMIDGVVAANGLTGGDADVIRSRLTARLGSAA
jgi:hypothetical protein